MRCIAGHQRRPPRLQRQVACCAENHPQRIRSCPPSSRFRRLCVQHVVHGGRDDTDEKRLLERIARILTVSGAGPRGAVFRKPPRLTRIRQSLAHPLPALLSHFCRTFPPMDRWVFTHVTLECKQSILQSLHPIPIRCLQGSVRLLFESSQIGFQITQDPLTLLGLGKVKVLTGSAKVQMMNGLEQCPHARRKPSTGSHSARGDRSAAWSGAVPHIRCQAEITRPSRRAVGAGLEAGPGRCAPAEKANSCRVGIPVFVSPHPVPLPRALRDCHGFPEATPSLTETRYEQP